MEELLFTYGATKRIFFLKLKLPTALPHFFSAIKMSVPMSVIGAAIAEWLGAQKGLGYFSKRMMHSWTVQGFLRLWYCCPLWQWWQLASLP